MFLVLQLGDHDIDIDKRNYFRVLPYLFLLRKTNVPLMSIPDGYFAAQ
jgi:hypothetical protein